MSDTAPTVLVSERLRHATSLPAPSAVSAAPHGRHTTVVVRGVALLAFLDTLAAFAAVLGVLVGANVPEMPRGVEQFLSARITVKNLLLLLLLAAAWPVVFKAFGLYDARHLRRFTSEAARLVAAVSVGAALAVVFPLTSVSGTFSIRDLVEVWVVWLGLAVLVRAGRRVVDGAEQRLGRRVLIVGTGRLARRVHRDITADPLHRYEVLGFLDEPLNGETRYERVPDRTIGTLEHLEAILMRQVVDEVVIALPVKSCYQQIQHAIGVCERAGVEARYGADLFESTVAFPEYEEQGDRAFVAMKVAPDGYRIAAKRAFDVAAAAIGLVLLGPFLLLVAAAIKLTSRGPVLYSHQRCGLNKRTFRMYKFRSMYADAEAQQVALEDRNEASGPVFKIKDDPRITPLGLVLRRSSIDELPQLWNVLCGDMSLVGPRPLPLRDVGLISRPSDMRRFSMRPGITCLWQVQGRSNLSFERWVELDLEYIDNWSLGLDLRILVRTIPAVLSANGAT